MPFCKQCGNPLDNDARFCTNCGYPLSVSSGAATIQRQRIQEYAGKIIKCPNCGESLASFQAVCPTCGHEIRGASVVSVVKELADKLDAIDAQPDSKPKWIFSRKRDLGQLTEKEKRKIDLIRHFPIPNTKEDLLEFLILASSNIIIENEENTDAQGSSSNFEQALSDAWKAKYDQAYHKAQLSFGDSQEFRKIASTYEEKVEEQKRKARREERNEFIYSILGVILIAFLFTLFYLYTSKLTSEDKVSNTQETVISVSSDVDDSITNPNSEDKVSNIKETETSNPIDTDDSVADLFDEIMNGIDAGIEAFSSWLDNIGE